MQRSLVSAKYNSQLELQVSEQVDSSCAPVPAAAAAAGLNARHTGVDPDPESNF